MKNRIIASALATVLIGAASFAAAAPADAPAALPDWSKTAAEWDKIVPTGGAGSSGVAKVKVVTLLGDPSKPGPYTQLLRVAPHVPIQAHHHAGDRVAVVLKGTIMFGYGAEFNRDSMKVLPTGSIYTEPSGSPHFAVTGDEEAVVVISGYGPTDTAYEDPANDPTRQGGKK